MCVCACGWTTKLPRVAGWWSARLLPDIPPIHRIPNRGERVSKADRSIAHLPGLLPPFPPPARMYTYSAPESWVDMAMDRNGDRYFPQDENREEVKSPLL